MKSLESAVCGIFDSASWQLSLGMFWPCSRIHLVVPGRYENSSRVSFCWMDFSVAFGAWVGSDWGGRESVYAMVAKTSKRMFLDENILTIRNYET